MECDIHVSAGAVDLTRLSKTYALSYCRVEEVPTIDRVSFHVSTGNCFGMLGNNGSGKRTIFEVLTGKLHASSGTALIGGYNVRTDDRQVSGTDHFTCRRPPHTHCLV